MHLKLKWKKNKQVSLDLTAWLRVLYESCVTGQENLEVTKILGSRKLSKKHSPVTRFT